METGIFQMIWGAGPMVKIVILILFIFSVLSWAIIGYKVLLLRKIEKETTAFYDLFWEKRQFSQIQAESKNFSSTPLIALFNAAYAEVASSLKTAESDRKEAKLVKDDIERIQRVLKKASSTESARLERMVGFLATTGNAAPFIGLFGTVWGIMDSFRNIGAKGAANLAVVAPGISEALVATAMGLAAAIPAVIGYNHILTRIDRITNEMDNFSMDVINIIDKQARKQP